jgi:hypothetical protein
MTDTFPSGFSSPTDAGEPAGDVTGTLAELERKLRELERELTSIGRRRVRPEGDDGERQPSVDPPPARLAAADLPGGRLVDERIDPQRLTLPVQPAVSRESAPPPPRDPVPPPPSSPLPPPAQRTPPAPSPARAEAVGNTDEWRPTEAQLAGLAELRSFRERLERFAKDLVADYDAVLARVMSEVSLSARGEPQAPPPPPPLPEHEEPLFEGRVELGVGPFYDIGSLGAFEQRVASVPNVTEVSVRRFEASHAVVDVRLATPVALLSELRRVLDTDFGVRHVASGRIALTFDES